MNYLIFGGEGFIGRHLISYLISEGFAEPSEVHSLDIRQTSDFSNFHRLDVRHPIHLDLPDLRNSIVFNLAAVHTTPGHPDREYFETNILGAKNICEFAERNGIAKIVFTSSIAPYGASEENKTEESLPMPNTPYGISKLVAEHVFKTWHAGDPTVRQLSIVRPGVVFGKGEGGNFTRLYRAQKKGIFFYPGRRNTLKASVYVKDVVRILYETITTDLPNRTCLYNVTYFPAPSIEKICGTISEVTGVSKPGGVIPAWILKMAAFTIYNLGGLFGAKFNGIHPDRVKKLMVSTNINGEKLSESQFKLKYDLLEALQDWKKDCGNVGLE
jgi:nucleoside-diphosphate-sugar epimerase